MLSQILEDWTGGASVSSSIIAVKLGTGKGDRGQVPHSSAYNEPVPKKPPDVRKWGVQEGRGWEAEKLQCMCTL